jgi:DNA-binding GntR family transcriptional regulator
MASQTHLTPYEAGGEHAAGGEGLDSTAHAYREVRRAILDGGLPPGSVFSQVQLAARLGISRTPLREALRLLQNEGLVRAEVRRRFRVASLDLGDLEQLYAMRVGLEPLAVRATVPLLGDAELADMRRALEEGADALARGEAAALRPPHRRFHLGLVAHAGARLFNTVSELWDHAERYRLMYHQTAQDEMAVYTLAQSEHRAILTAAESHDGECAGGLLAQHLARTALTIFAARNPGQEPRLIRDALRHSGPIDFRPDGQGPR